MLSIGECSLASLEESSHQERDLSQRPSKLLLLRLLIAYDRRQLGAQIGTKAGRHCSPQQVLLVSLAHELDQVQSEFRRSLALPSRKIRQAVRLQGLTCGELPAALLSQFPQPLQTQRRTTFSLIEATMACSEF